MVTLSQILSFSGYVFYDRIDGKNRKVPGSAEIQWGEVYCQIHAIFFLSIICTIIDAILVEICRSRFRASETITASNGRHTQCSYNPNRQKTLALYFYWNQSCPTGQKWMVLQKQSFNFLVFIWQKSKVNKSDKTLICQHCRVGHGNCAS